MNNSVHTLDLPQWVMGMPRRVFADTAVHPIEVEDLAAGLLKWDNGARQCSR